MQKEEEKKQLFPQELYLRQQMERQSKPLLQQRESYVENYQLEKSLVNKLVMESSFLTESNLENWEMASFYPGNSENATEIRGNWLPANLEVSAKGMQLRSFAMRTKPTISLKSIACEIKLKFRLAGDSTFWIITRGSALKDADAVICKIKKEQETQRVFLIFGANIGKNNEFKFFKKQEFPEISKNGEEIVQDYVDMKIKFIDNGDERVFVEALLGKDKTISMSCDKFIPCFNNTQIVLAGSGDSVLLKSFSARQINRIIGRPNLTRYECCQII